MRYRDGVLLRIIFLKDRVLLPRTYEKKRYIRSNGKILRYRKR